jgi:flagellar basal-body rod protein FlgG
VNNALWAAKSGLDAQQSRMAVISNNLANVNTAGFKRDRAVFEDLLYQKVRQPGGQVAQDAELPSGLAIGTGVRLAATQKIHSQGGLQITENALDLAIEGRGFFEVQMPDGGIGYTRDGSFQLSADGQMVNANGYALTAGITVPANATSLTIGRDGTVSAQLPGTTAQTQLGTIQLADFVNPSGLEPVGTNLFRESAASGGAIQGVPGQAGIGQLLQGSIESSNVNIVEELISMIETQRAYELNSKAISTTDGMLQFANNNI